MTLGLENGQGRLSKSLESWMGLLSEQVLDAVLSHHTWVVFLPAKQWHDSY